MLLFSPCSMPNGIRRVGRNESKAFRISGRDVNQKIDTKSNPDFTSWFRDSSVVDEAGVPLLLYHGTDDPWYVPTLRHGMGPHYGSIDTAQTRQEHREIGSDDIWLFAAYLRIERPVMLRDVHFDEAGIAYRNQIEGGGTLSWIPFALEQIWEVPEDPSS